MPTMTATETQAARDVAAAIASSASEDRTVTLDWSEEAETDLLSACDDSAEGVDGEDQYWGETGPVDSPTPWRVHLRRAE